MDPSPTKHSACSGCQWRRDSQGGPNAEYSDVAGDKNLGFGMCSNLIPTELGKHHNQPQAHTTVKFLWALQWISCVRISLDMMVKIKVLPLPVSDPGHPTYFMEQHRLHLTGNQSRNMRINSWRVCNIQHWGLHYETFTQIKCTAIQNHISIWKTQQWNN